MHDIHMYCHVMDSWFTFWIVSRFNKLTYVEMKPSSQPSNYQSRSTYSSLHYRQKNLNDKCHRTLITYMHQQQQFFSGKIYN
jgi:hypothetical protein